VTGPDLQRWIADHARDLASVVPGADGDDLAPLAATVAGTRLLGVGEAVVGTRELAMLAHRVTATAIDGGARVVALGAPEAATTVVDQALAEGEDPGSAVESMGAWRWETGDVRAALAWLAEHNAGRAPEERVRVVGVDPASPAPAARAVGLHLRRTDRALVDEVGPRLHDLVGHRPERGPLPDEVLDAARRVCEGLDRDGVPDAVRRHARALARAAELAVAPAERRRDVRERLMSDAVAALVEGAGGSAGAGPAVVWWGHVRHVRVRLDDDGPSAGARLRERYGRGYYALGLLAGRGEFRARHRRRLRSTTRNPVLHRLPAPPPGSIEETLGQGGSCLLDLRGGADRDGIPEWATTATRMRVLDDPTSVGWKQAFEPATPEEYDGLAYVDHVRQAAVR
jgi:erythromycin esterase